MTSRKCFLTVIQLSIVLISSDVSADFSDTEKTKPDYKWFVSVYWGVHTNEDLHEMAVLEADYSGGNYLSVVALAREIYRYKQWVSVELEGQAGKHFGQDNDHWESVGAILGRWHPFPWDKYIDSSFAMGAGLSYNSDQSNSASFINQWWWALPLMFGWVANPKRDLHEILTPDQAAVENRGHLGDQLFIGCRNFHPQHFNFAFLYYHPLAYSPLRQ
jgi:hypothetical protein